MKKSQHFREKLLGESSNVDISKLEVGDKVKFRHRGGRQNGTGYVDDIFGDRIEVELLKVPSSMRGAGRGDIAVIEPQNITWIQGK